MQTALNNIKEADRVLRKESKDNVIENGFYLRGRYQIITLNPKPSWITTEEWLKMRRNGELKREIKRVSPVHHNLIMLDTNTGLNLFMQHLAGDDTFPLVIDNASIGTGTTPPTQSDVDLVTPVLEDILVAISELTGVGTLYTEWFMTNDELANGEYTEFGLFCGTQLFARSLIQSPTHTKEDNEDTLIAYTITAEVVES